MVLGEKDFAWQENGTDLSESSTMKRRLSSLAGIEIRLCSLGRRCASMCEIFCSFSVGPYKGCLPPPKRMNFRKSSKGEGVIFNPKIYVAKFGPLNGAI